MVFIGQQKDLNNFKPQTLLRVGDVEINCPRQGLKPLNVESAPLLFPGCILLLNALPGPVRGLCLGFPALCQERSTRHLYLLRAHGVLLPSTPQQPCRGRENIDPGCLFIPSVLSDRVLLFDKIPTTCKISSMFFHNWDDLFYQ